MTTVNQAPVAHVRQIRELPGPSGWPVLGNALDVNPSTVHLKAEEWAREFGEAYRIRIASRKFVVLSNPETVAKILRDRPDGFGRTTRFSETAEELAFGGVLSSNGEAWKRQRPMVLSGLDPAHLKRFFPTLSKVTQRLASRWQGAATAGEPIDLQADLMRYTVDVTAGLALGTDINTIESKEEVIQEHLDKILPAFFKRTLAPIRYWRVFKLPSDRELDRHVNALRKAVQSFITEARRRLDEEPQRREHPTNLIEAMLVAHEKERGLTDEDVSRNVLTMLLAGEDTTANTLAWMIWLLHGKPDAKSRATEEVRALLNGATQPVDLEQVGRLDFIEACAHETMRLKPVVPLQGIQAHRDTEVGGIFLPAGTVVWLLLRPGAVDERHFPDAKDFRPERWLSGMSASSAKRVAMPFGAGPRMCPGRYLALAEIKIVMAMLLGSFEIDRVTTPDGQDARERLALTMSPVGLKMHLRLRKSA